MNEQQNNRLVKGENAFEAKTNINYILMEDKKGKLKRDFV